MNNQRSYETKVVRFFCLRPKKLTSQHFYLDLRIKTNMLQQSLLPKSRAFLAKDLGYVGLSSVLDMPQACKSGCCFSRLSLKRIVFPAITQLRISRQGNNCHWKNSALNERSGLLTLLML
ncbi:hypothetical protein RRG08_029537 [Elysia crispata]|uniref:Uncharacterized protein n=1 Tax=Elysia crispata TaxID=231223 RepID=A0AAE0XVR2_9GAST|nr:hypothetical protein RRG08_029537 [Elysia crispata]